MYKKQCLTYKLYKFLKIYKRKRNILVKINRQNIFKNNPQKNYKC